MCLIVQYAIMAVRNLSGKTVCVCGEAEWKMCVLQMISVFSKLRSDACWN